ncbi:M42 family metallopeptidase [Agrobacterium vitis]|uniref:M20/M25/M40 family metallo-hydrolase n=1 Tax=Agrobacterium vitis TaxID=373 RepID=A0AAE5AWM9_AGRVI|nr:M20/M25/M40 family metallo-hydrolase [Agrobacterium vitis]MCF1500084.1 M42 family metallopeptidase [Allorhizobium sp. Av2]MCM2442231.1 M42 family metallopeptidase [Agrobacterium vitis]MUZ58641.1 M20/M25/M40 family metallo-hydrolase [Agrobacterium vitis]MVA66276.1 M20/M25/M40 family metallo-hydrolase [Agrobacterium vitis]MVA88313.1 M20/M25/M40 family metallo-hydrolase [Agrobacterium vitis]
MKLLERLVRTPGVPGREARVRAVIEEHILKAGIFDEVRTDALGSLIGLRHPRPSSGPPSDKPTRILLAAHMDQIGFLVSHITPDGLLYLLPVGWFDVRTLLARQVTVCTEGGGDLPGILLAPGRPMQIASSDDMKKLPETTGLYVDLSMSGEAVRKKVRPGDMVVLDTEFGEIGRSVVGAALDDRVGCWVLIRALEGLTHHDCEIYAVWTTQEELGSRGAGPVAAGYAAEIGISCDTIASCNVPGVPGHEHISQLGDGVSLVIADGTTLSDMSLVAEFEQLAAELGIKCQRSLISGGGQDGAMIQRSRQGVKTIVLSCPVKNMHTAVEMVNKSDLASYRQLITAFLSKAA